MATELVLLGTGTPNAEADRHGSALAVVVDGHSYLVDFGPGVVRRALRAWREQGIEALAPQQLRLAFLTHLHHDHTAGLPDLLLTPWTLGRRDPLTVYGPLGLDALAGGAAAAWREDVRERLESLEPANDGGQRLLAREFGTPGTVFQDERVEVRAFRVEHGSWPAWAYRFETAEGCIVVSGDTAPCAGIEAAARGCDILVHEVYSARSFAALTPAWQRYHGSVHTSTSELAALARRVRPGLLLLVHQLSWGGNGDTLPDEVREGYDGPVLNGRDLQRVPLPLRRQGGSVILRP
ncbi:MAG: MBL fold metallo-hydrolase [Anaerolineaceae bacterium]|nr:MBL fold metallo-hydrolase [Anaerolineaceae bacterium]